MAKWQDQQEQYPVSLTHHTTEKAVLSSILNNLNRDWYGHVSRISGDDAAGMFADHKHRAVYQAIEDISKLHGIASLAGIIDRIDARYSGVIDSPEDFVASLQLAPSLSTTEQMDAAVKELGDLQEMRKQVSGMERIIRDMSDREVVARPDDIAARMQSIVDDTNVKTSAETFGEIARDVLNADAPTWSVKTGIDVIDKALGGKGLEAGCFTIAAARPKVGKTILMNTLIYKVLENGGIPLVLNLETKKIEFFSKMVSRYLVGDEEDGNHLDIGWGRIKDYITTRRSGEEMEYPFTRQQKQEVEDGFLWAQEQEWMVSFDKNMSQQDIYSFVMNAKNSYPQDAKIVLFVDYIQLQVQNSMREREEIAGLSRFYKKLAGTANISVFSLAQLNRDAGDSKPKIHQLRGSGALEQDADTILLLDRPHTRAEDKENTTDNPPFHLNIDASTSRLSQGDEDICFIDGSVQLVSNLPEHLKHGAIGITEEEI